MEEQQSDANQTAASLPCGQRDALVRHENNNGKVALILPTVAAV